MSLIWLPIRRHSVAPRPCRLTFIMGDDRDESDDDPSSLGDESVAYGEDVDDFDPSSPPPCCTSCTTWFADQ